MSVKTLDEIKQIIQDGRPKWVEQAIMEHKRLDVHINGKHTAAYLEHIDGLESNDKLKLRRKFLTTNRHLFVDLARPIDKVFSAKGGGNIYNTSTDTQEKKLRTELSNVRHGKTIRRWIKDIQSNKYYTDPAGLVFFEWTEDKTYPTIKSIKSITNYETQGRFLEWVLFEGVKVLDKDGNPTGLEKIRFVDDAFDYTFIWDGENLREVEDEIYVNPWGKVPAIVNSNIINSDLTYAESPFEVVISLADHYLRTGTIKNVNEFLHGFPIFWRFLTDCPECEGTGQVDGKTCSYCNGKGINLKKDVTDIINLSIPENADDVNIAPDLAGYVTPDTASWQEMRTEQDWLYGLSQLAMWGARLSRDADNETATAAFLKAQPVNDQLNNFSDAFEDIEKKMTDFIGEFYLKEYDGASISYGRRFLVEPPDVIWKKYNEARQQGAPKTSLDYLLTQFYQSEYSNDLQSMAIAMKGIKLEPFIHKTDEEVSKLPIMEEDKKAKYYFNEWYKQLTEMELLTKTVEQLQNEFNNYLNDKKNESETSGVQSTSSQEE